VIWPELVFVNGRHPSPYKLICIDELGSTQTLKGLSMSIQDPLSHSLLGHSGHVSDVWEWVGCLESHIGWDMAWKNVYYWDFPHLISWFRMVGLEPT